MLPILIGEYQVTFWTCTSLVRSINLCFLATDRACLLRGADWIVWLMVGTIERPFSFSLELPVDIFSRWLGIFLWSSMVPAIFHGRPWRLLWIQVGDFCAWHQGIYWGRWGGGHIIPLKTKMRQVWEPMKVFKEWVKELRSTSWLVIKGIVAVQYVPYVTQLHNIVSI